MYSIGDLVSAHRMFFYPTPLQLSAQPNPKYDSLGNMKFLCGLILIVLGATMPALAQKKIVQPKEFAAGGPFSPAVLIDGTLYASGQIGRDLKTQQVPKDFEAEVRQVLDNIGIILREAKMNYADVVSVQVYLTDMDLFSRMNAVTPHISRPTVPRARQWGLPNSPHRGHVSRSPSPPDASFAA